MVKILVLMSSYNGEKYIKSQVESIINQEFSGEITLRIRDDGSTDKTCSIIENIIEQYPGKIELIRGKNIGYNASFFELIKNANNYDYYAISDQDDIWLSNKLQIACDFLKKENDIMPLLYASTSYLIEDDLMPYGQTRKKIRDFTIYNTIIQNICPGHTQVFNNSLLLLIKEKFDLTKIYVYDSWITNMAMLYGKIIFNNESFTYYRQHQDNQLGSGVGKIGQLIASRKRIKSGDGHKYRKQIEYFVDCNKNELKKQGFYEELFRYIDARSFMKRVFYVMSSKLYRQSKIETVAFYFAVLVGKF